MYWILAVWLGKAIILVSRWVGNAGSALPGLIVERFYPDFISKASQHLSDGAVMVTGTNGKTTTNKLLAGIARSQGTKVLTNRAGGNLSRGIASAFLDHLNWRGQLDSTLGLFEVDEAFVGPVAAKLKPRYLVVLNLMRDQLDRYGELDRTAELIAKGIPHSQGAILNADDPLVSKLAKARPKNRLTLFGATDAINKQLPHDGLLHGASSNAKHKKTPQAAFKLTHITKTPNGQKVSISYQGRSFHGRTKLPGVFNAYNVLAALAAATRLGYEPAAVLASIQDIEPAFGRSELIKIGGKSIQLLLVKNPSGFNQIIKTFLASQNNSPVLIAINDNFADGRDVSWLWDVDFESIRARNHQIIASGLRSYDMALRLKYAGVLSDTITDPKHALTELLKRTKAGETAYIVPTYTAMLNLRRILKKPAGLKEVWQ